MYDFLKEETFELRHQLTFIGDTLEMYIPTTYFTNEPNMANEMGEYIECMGILFFKTNGKLYDMQLPIKFLFGYSEKKKWTGSLSPELKSKEYDVFILHKGDAFCYDLNHRESLSDIMFFMNNLVEGGKMPDIIPYKNILEVLLLALGVTKAGSIGLSSVSYELLLSELYRSKNNINTPYRMYINDHPGKEYDYKMIKLTKIPETSSNFLSLIGEDINHQIVSSIYNTRTGRKDKISPAEKLLKL